MKKFLAGVALSLFAVSAHAATVSPFVFTLGEDELWSFAPLLGDGTAYESDRTLDIGSGAESYYVDFYVAPTEGSLTLEVTNSGSAGGAEVTAQLLGPRDLAGSYSFYFDGDLIFEVDGISDTEIASFTLAPLATADLMWVWSVDKVGAVSTTLSPAPVPVPAAGFLLIAGLGGLAALRRKKKA